jgi:hypothetical protein
VQGKISMFVIFFLLLAGIGYGSLFFRWNPVILVLGIIGIVVLMLVPMGEDIYYESTVTDSVGNVTVEQIVLFSLIEGYEYTAWIWLHVALLVTHTVFLFSYMMGKMA